jgi:hypothetical protein
METGYRLTTRSAGLWQYLTNTEIAALSNRELPIPDLGLSGDVNFGMGGIFFFTARGYKAFKRVNQAACKAAKAQGEHIYLLTLDLDTIPADCIEYRDEYQVAISFRYFNPGRKNVCEYTACIERYK